MRHALGMTLEIWILDIPVQIPDSFFCFASVSIISWEETSVRGPPQTIEPKQNNECMSLTPPLRLLALQKTI